MSHNSGSMVDNGGMVDNGSVVHNRGMVDNGSMEGRSMSKNRGSMDSMGKGTSSIVVHSTSSWGNLSKTLAVLPLVNSSVSSTEGLGDLDRSHLTISLSNRLVAGLTGSSVD